MAGPSGPDLWAVSYEKAPARAGLCKSDQGEKPLRPPQAFGSVVNRASETQQRENESSRSGARPERARKLGIRTPRFMAGHDLVCHPRGFAEPGPLRLGDSFKRKCRPNVMFDGSTRTKG